MVEVIKMSLLNLQEYAKVKKKLDFRITLYYSGLTGIALFFFILLSGLVGTAFIVGILTFLLLFGLVYGILYLQTNSVLKKLGKLEINGTYLVVTLMNEMGILLLDKDQIKYTALLGMSNTKKLDMQVNEDLFIAYGEVKRRKRDNWKYGEYKKCHITLREMPHGMVRHFVFFDIDGLLDKVGEKLGEISVFNSQKYQ